MPLEKWKGLLILAKFDLFLIKASLSRFVTLNLYASGKTLNRWVKKMKLVMYFVIGIAIVIQFIQPDFKNPAVDEKVALNSDPHVMSVLKTSCYDCHSSETKYPWYQNVAPVSWVMSDHIVRGRKALDFSNWANIDAKVKLERLERAKQMVNNEMMPKHEYLLMHKNAVLNAKEKQTLEQFFDSQIKELGGTPNTLKAFNI